MPGYEVRLHRDADKSLSELPDDVTERIKTVIREVSESRKPTSHSKCTVLNNNHSETLYKIRVGSYRVLAELEKPELRVLRVGERSKVYEGVDGLYAGM